MEKDNSPKENGLLQAENEQLKEEGFDLLYYTVGANTLVRPYNLITRFLIMKKTKIFTLLFVFMLSINVYAQPTITFTPSSGATLTRADVTNILATNGLTRDDAFHAVITNADSIANVLTYLTPSGVFQDCIGLLSVSSTTLIVVGERGFEDCSALTTIDFPNLTTVRFNAFLNCDLQTVNLPNVNTVKGSAFRNNANLVSVSLPNVDTLEPDVFRDCFALTTVHLPNATQIGNNAFQNCSALVSIELPSATRLGIRVFSNCTALSTVYLPNVDTMGGGLVFENCVSLTSLELPKVKRFALNIFNGCTNLSSLKLGTGFTTPTNISVTGGSLSGFSPANVDLCLDINVLPIPDLTNSLWNWEYWNSIIVGCDIPIPTYFLTLEVNPVEAGTVSGNGEYTENVFAKFSASASSNYNFKSWTNKTNGNVVSTNRNDSIKMIQNYTLVANFEEKPVVPDSFWVSISPVQPIGGTVEGAGKYEVNDIATLIATANEGYKFLHWLGQKEGSFAYDSIVSDENPFEIIVDKHISLSVRFVLDEVEPVTKFTASLNSNPVNAGTTTGTGSYDSNSVISISATANECFVFRHWANNEGETVSDENPFGITVVSDTVLTAVFELKKFNVTVAATANGLVAPELTDTEMNCGAEIEITATAEEGYKFRNWTSNGTVISTLNPLPVTILRDTNLIANFIEEDVEIELFEVKIGSINPEGSGTVEGAGEFEKNTSVTLTAKENPDFEFVNWTDENDNIISEENPFTFILTQDTVIIANFNYTSITESNLISSIRISPNPTDAHATVSVDLDTAGNLTVTLNNLLGQELLEIHNDFTSAGEFSRTFSIATLPIGVYYLKIVHNGNVKVEKVVRQ